MKKFFLWFVTGMIVLIALTYILQIVFIQQTEKFANANFAFALSIFFLFAYKNALKPTKKYGGPRNPTKRRYEKKGELHKYQDLCKKLVVAAIAIGLFLLILGFIEIFIYHIIN